MVQESKPKALIVDDSKTARVVLRQMLDKHRYSVDMVESGEQALNYLEAQAPDLIFMDHMMPGMDGFQAVKAIKSNPQRAAIPIVMYTSKEGEVYLGQARALGAADILSKPASPAELSALLKRLHTQPLTLVQGMARPVSAEQPRIRTAEIPIAKTIEMPAVDLVDDAAPWASITPSDATASGASRAVAEAPPVAANAEYGDTYSGYRQPGAGGASWVMPLLLLLAVLVFGTLYLEADGERRELHNRQGAIYQTMEWAVNQAGTYPYGEPPLAGKRLELLSGLVAQLATLGFQGEIVVESHVGEFCLVNAEDGSWTVAPPALPITECTAIGESAAQAQSLSAEQSVEFSDFLTNAALRDASGIVVTVVALGASRPAYPYPDDLVETAGEWNQIAERNNRVRISVRPAATGMDRAEAAE